MDKAPELRLKPGREKSLLRRHPWVFSGAVAAVHGEPAAGENLRIIDSRGKFLALGAYSPRSQIRARVWSWQEDVILDEAFFHRRLNEAITQRQVFVSSEQTNALRLVHGESDGLPGLVVDRYAETLVVQFLSSGVEYWRETIIRSLMEVPGVTCIYERSDVDARHLEGMELRRGLLYGSEPSGSIVIYENGLAFGVDIKQGHKTGFYLDQRNNRLKLRKLAAGRSVLDCFCYTGGFAINAVAGGASRVLAVDASGEVLQQGCVNLARNSELLVHSSEQQQVEWLKGDIFETLRSFRDAGRSFDMIILDPPKFAPTVSQVARAARGYKDINLLAFKLLSPGGLLFTFSCSGGLSAELFQKIVADAALDANVGAQIIERLSQAPDHPVALNFPEGAYLKGLVVRVV